VTPLWGAERMLGTNPIAIAFPGKDEPPIVIDMATCAAAYGKIEMARRRGQPIPQGWGIDNQGRGTTNPDDIVAGGALLPLGSDRERGGHKVMAWPSWSTFFVVHWVALIGVRLRRPLR